METLKKTKRFIRPILCRLGIINDAVGYRGYFKTFGEAAGSVARMHGGGYDSDAIFRKVSESTLAVLRGEAVFERDSFLFYTKEINYNLMMYLYKYHIQDRKLDVLDFGGALGTTYLQHRKELEDIEARWTVTEQEHFVDFGKKNITAGNLRFASSEELEPMWGKFNVLLFSGVLQYIEDAESVIRDACSRKVRRIIIERTPVSDGTWCWVETVHAPIYEAVYPCRVFEESSFIKLFTDNHYELVDSWPSLVDGDIYANGKTVRFKSFVFKWKSQDA